MWYNRIKLQKTPTACCALCQINNVDNLTSKKEIQLQMDTLAVQKVNNREVGVTTGHGQTAAFIIVSPGEDVLERNLIELGFEQKHTFERRVGYPQTGDLKMFIKNV